MELAEKWQNTLKIFSETLEDKIAFDSVYSHSLAKDVINNELIITTDYKFNVDMFTPDVIKQLESIYNSIENTNHHIKVLSKEDYNQQYQKPTVSTHKDYLNPDYNFNNFVVGNSNRIAQNASLAVAMKPGIAYSPLFIYSHSGLGKTHLLNSIGNYVKQKDPSKRILYSTSEQFVNEYINSLSNNTVNEFNEKYRGVDVLLIDDIQFIATKEASSEMFFNIFNSLQNDNKQIVITSDKSPKELKGMENRLVSRFVNGLTVSIDTPEFETAKAILRKKLEIENIDYPIHEDVLDFIASHFNNDVRELEGSLKRLLFYKLVFGKDIDQIDMNFALEAFKDTYESKSNSNELTIDGIKQCVADYYNLTVAQINSKSRTSHLIIARHIAMYLIRTLIPDVSFVQIGKEFGGRDHSTVMKACDKVEKNIQKDANYKKAIEEIKSKFI